MPATVDTPRRKEKANDLNDVPVAKNLKVKKQKISIERDLGIYELDE